jgi:hypothetical protein
VTKRSIDDSIKPASGDRLDHTDARLAWSLAANCLLYEADPPDRPC